MAVQGYTSPNQIPKKLDFTIPEGLKESSADEIFDYYKSKGLINPEYKNINSWLNDVKKVANKNEWAISKAANVLTANWKLKSGEITDVEFRKFLNTRPGFVGPLKHEGIPLRYERYKPNNLPGDLKEWSSGKLPYKVVDFDKRAFQERIPLQIQEYFETLEDAGTIPEGSFQRYRSWVYKGNRLNDQRAAMFSRRVDILKHFDKGHITALMNSTLTGGSNDPISQLVQLANENRSIGNKNLIPEHISRAADLPTNWGESAAYWLADQKGSTGTGLPLNSLLDSDKALLTRADANPDKVVAQVFDRLDALAQDIEATRVSNLGDSESLALINKQFQNNRYVAPTVEQQLTKAKAAATKGQNILGVLKNPAVQKGLKIGGIGLGAAGIYGDLTSTARAKDLLTKSDATTAEKFEGTAEAVTGVSGLTSAGIGATNFLTKAALPGAGPLGLTSAAVGGGLLLGDLAVKNRQARDARKLRDQQIMSGEIQPIPVEGAVIRQGKPNFINKTLKDAEEAWKTMMKKKPIFPGISE